VIDGGKMNWLRKLDAQQRQLDATERPVVMCCNLQMYVAGTRGKGLGNIVECSRCGCRRADRQDLVDEFIWGPSAVYNRP